MNASTHRRPKTEEPAGPALGEPITATPTASRGPWSASRFLERLGPARRIAVDGVEERFPVPTCNNEGQVLLSQDGLSFGQFWASPSDPGCRFSGLTGETVFAISHTQYRVRALGRRPMLVDPCVIHRVPGELVYYREATEEPVVALWIGIRHQFHEPVGPSGAGIRGTEGLQAEAVAADRDPSSPPDDRLTMAFLDSEVFLASFLLQRVALEGPLERDLAVEVLRALADAVARSVKGGRFSEVLDPELDAWRGLLGARETPSETLATLCAAAGSSEATAYRRFRSELDTSPNDYRRESRVRRALLGIRDGGPLSDLAGRFGFKSASYFSRSFRAVFGLSPSVIARKPLASLLELSLERLAG